MLEINDIEQNNQRLINNEILITIIIIKTYIWDPLIRKWLFFLQLKCKNESTKSIYLLFT